MKVLELILGITAGAAVTGGYLYFTRKKNTEDYIRRMMLTWIVEPSPKKVPIKKLAVLSIELGRYLYGKMTTEKVMSSTAKLKDIADELNYKLSRKQWSKVRIAARKLLRSKTQGSMLAEMNND